MEPVTSETVEGKVEMVYGLKSGVSFHFFSSQAPCEITCIGPS